jgi:hypothetical protein
MPSQSPNRPVTGATTGVVNLLLRFEGAALFVASLIGYAEVGAGWPRFVALFLLPDLAMLAYMAGPRIGAVAYNAAHSTLGPAALALLGWRAGLPALPATALVWTAHIGFDRLAGYGLKYAAGFHATHLGEKAAWKLR